MTDADLCRACSSGDPSPRTGLCELCEALLPNEPPLTTRARAALAKLTRAQRSWVADPHLCHGSSRVAMKRRLYQLGLVHSGREMTELGREVARLLKEES